MEKRFFIVNFAEKNGIITFQIVNTKAGVKKTRIGERIAKMGKKEKQKLLLQKSVNHLNLNLKRI